MTPGTGPSSVWTVTCLPRVTVRSDPADPGKLQEPLVVDRTDHQPDLVAVTADRDARGVSVALVNRDGVAVGVDARLVGVLRDVLKPAALAVGFEPGRRRQRKQLVQELPTFRIHTGGL